MAATPFRRVVARRLSNDFNTTVLEEVTPRAPAPNEVIIQNRFLGVNASDINFTAGKYLPNVPPPLYPGFEALGVVIGKGDKVSHVGIGDSVAATGFGLYTEVAYVKAANVMPVPFLDPRILTLLVSGLTASMALEQVGEMKSQETVLVTAAAGATGHLAVQLAKLAGNHVIGTCRSDSKARWLTSLGCDRVINYAKEDLKAVLAKEYPKGVNLVYESVGGKTFEDCVSNLALKGRLIIIGMMSGYADGTAWNASSSGLSSGSLASTLLTKSASVRGFFLNHYASEMPRHISLLTQLMKEGKLTVQVDPTKFVGLEQVKDAVNYLYEGKNEGKVVVELKPVATPIRSRL